VVVLDVMEAVIVVVVIVAVKAVVAMVGFSVVMVRVVLEIVRNVRVELSVVVLVIVVCDRFGNDHCCHRANLGRCGDFCVRNHSE